MCSKILIYTDIFLPFLIIHAVGADKLLEVWLSFSSSLESKWRKDFKRYLHLSIFFTHTDIQGLFFQSAYMSNSQLTFPFLSIGKGMSVYLCFRVLVFSCAWDQNNKRKEGRIDLSNSSGRVSFYEYSPLFHSSHIFFCMIVRPLSSVLHAWVSCWNQNLQWWSHFYSAESGISVKCCAILPFSSISWLWWEWSQSTRKRKGEEGG